MYVFLFPMLLSAQQGSYAVSFDGANGYIAIPHNAVFNVSRVTIEMWMYWGNCGGAGDIDFPIAKNIEQLEVHTLGGAASNGLRFIPTTGVYLDTPLNSFTASAWHHIAFMYDPTTSFAQCMIDGTAVPLTNNGGNPLTTAITTSTAELRLGSRSGGSYPFCGKLDEVRIWNTIRTTGEITANKDNELTGSETGLVAYYKMNTGSGTTLSDNQASHLNNGTLMSGASWASVTGPLYLNFRNVDGSEKNVAITSVWKLTFDGSSVIVNKRGPDVSPQVLPFTTLQRMTAGDVSAGVPLPVELISFSGKAMQHAVVLSWMTATEVNNYGFDIERSSTISGWTKIGFVRGHGSSSSPHEYSYSDSPQKATTFRYRLKQIDGDGKYEYSAIVSVMIGTPATYELKPNYPNPFNPSTTIAYQIPVDGFVAMKVYDVLGKEVATLVNENRKAGSYDVIFDGSALTSGLYICRMNAAAYSSATKMLLSK